MNILIGGGYAPTLAGFVTTTRQNNRHRVLEIMVLPISFSSNALDISAGERAANLQAAEERRQQIEAECAVQCGTAEIFRVRLAPIFTREDAQNPVLVAPFQLPQLTAVFILGGDQQVAMQIVMHTPLEETLTQAAERGVIFAGTSAGLAVQSYAMIAGYTSDKLDVASGLYAGAVDFWHSPSQRGLPFGVQGAIVEQHFFQRSRVGRLLNALVHPDAPPIGIGVDGYTAAKWVEDDCIQEIFGEYGVGIFDAETFGAAQNARFVSDYQTLSMPNVLVHLLAPGNFAYTVRTRQTSFAPRLKSVPTRPPITLPAGAGTLILSGMMTTSTILERFLSHCGTTPHLVVIWVGEQPPVLDYPSLKMIPLVQPLDSTTFNAVDGILLMVDADYQKQVQLAWLEPLRDVWRNGTPVLADGFAASLLGMVAAGEPLTPTPTTENPHADEDFIQGMFRVGRVQPIDGVGWLPLMLEPQIMEDSRWGQLFSLAYQHPQYLALGLPQNAGIELTADGATVIGENGVFSLDLQQASRSIGLNNTMVFANGLLSVYGVGDALMHC